MKDNVQVRVSGTAAEKETADYLLAACEALGADAHPALNIDPDMTVTVMGPFAACVSAEEKLVGYLQYLAAEQGWGLKAWSGVYSSAPTPFADKGVPAVSFARRVSSER